jgi:DNA-directed RNA polymerase subunit beta'
MIKNKKIDLNKFDAVTLRVASPDRILEWSRGEITKPETINYRTQRSEKGGLFDEKIFGPDKDYECYCGKYRGIRYKGITCEKCGVELTRSIVRRERMGHIELATPVSHIWFLRGIPSRIGLIMGMSMADLEKVIYFAGYIVTQVNYEEKEKFLKELESEFKNKVKNANDDKTKEALKDLMSQAKMDVEELREGLVLDEVKYHKYSLKYGALFDAGIGAEAIYEILKNLDMKKLEEELEAELDNASAVDTEKIYKRLSIVKAMNGANIRPEWMFLSRIPVIPPALRPMVALDGGRFATSDVNDLYRRVINRNNRLLKLKEISAPDVILRNEKRILQEAVDALIDNSMRQGSSVFSSATQAAKKELKSLSDNLKGKRGLFRQNLLGKRVDYSGRSVIVVGPELALDQCGLPKHMALELFRPFVINGLLKKELAFNIRGANRLIDEGIPEVWAILEDVIQGKHVLLNRAPTLHRLGIQAFRPVLIEGNAIQVHPLVCTAFNADFDGDQMAVHVPLSVQAQMEAKEIMASSKNIMKPGSGEPTVASKLLDIVLGVFWMTKTVEGEKGEGQYFATPEDAVMARDYGHLSYRAKIKVLAPDAPRYAEFNGGIFETTLGRLLFNEVLPTDYPYMNKEIDRKKLAAIVDDIINKYGLDMVPGVLDKIKNFGFKYTTVSGTTWGQDDIKIPAAKKDVIEKAKKLSDQVYGYYNEGLLTEEERIRKNIEIWHKAKGEVEKLIPQALDKTGSVYDMVTSGARGSLAQITQMAGMKGLISSTSGDTIEFPILSCSKEGLTPIEYFITTHGARKGLSDTALNTAKAGYLTRKLFVAAQDVVISEVDCGAKDGIHMKKIGALGNEVSIAKGIRGRVLAQDVVSPNGEVLFKKGTLVSKKDSVKIEESGVSEVVVRSPLSCKSRTGICVKCYGEDLGKNKMIDLGEAIGTVAAQAIGEPGTQLTMRTFHSGGTASVGGDIVSGLPRVEEVFEKRNPKNPAVIATVDGVVTGIKDLGKEKIITVLPEIEHKSKSGGEIEYSVHFRRTPFVKMGDKVKKGDFLTDGSAIIDEVFKYGGKEKALEYVIREVGKIYELQGESVSRKHIEVIVKQMFSRFKVKYPGGTDLSAGEIVDAVILDEENAKAKEMGLDEARADSLVLGISEVSFARKSFLSAASFQHTVRVLVNNAVKGSEDRLKGLMENVIIGRLIPAGTGYQGSEKNTMIEALTPKEEYSEEA